MKCFIRACNNPTHEYSRYCLEHLQRRGKSARQLQWEAENKEGIKEDLKIMKERKKEEWSIEKENKCFNCGEEIVEHEGDWCENCDNPLGDKYA